MTRCPLTTVPTRSERINDYDPARGRRPEQPLAGAPARLARCHNDCWHICLWCCSATVSLASLTTAACGGLRSTPDCRPRRALLHLSYSYAAPCGPALLVTQCKVEMWRGGCRSNISVSASFVWRCLSGSTMTPFPHPSHRTGHEDFPHPALGQDFTPSPTARRAQAGTGARARSTRKGARVDTSRPCVA